MEQNNNQTHARVIVIGSGPAGWTAAIYMARAKLAPILFSGEKAGGQLMLTTEIENFPGFPKGIQGPELMMQMREQAERFGTVVKDQNVDEVDFSSRPFRVRSGSTWYTGDAVLISTGEESVLTGVPGEKELIGRGVSMCAVCDAAFYKEKNVFVFGGGDSAMEDALALTKFAKKVTIVHRRDSFRASKIMQERAISNPKIEVMWNTSLKEIRGKNGVISSILVERAPQPAAAGASGQPSSLSQATPLIEELPAEGVFIAIGHKPTTALFADKISLDPKGYVVTSLVLGTDSLKHAERSLVDGVLKYPTMTSVEGVFAAGDVVDHKYRQAITAAGFGTMASLDIERWLESQE